MERAQLMKGILEGCILKLIERDETYGYEIVTRLQQYGFAEVREGTLYPLLLRLEKKELIQATYKSSPLGPKRKYYRLTKAGESYMDNFYQAWQEIVGSVEQIFGRYDR